MGAIRVVSLAVALALLGAACGASEAAKEQPDPSLATFSEEGFSFQYPKTWTIEESYEVTPQDWACANGSWYVTLRTPDDGWASMHRCILLGLGRIDTEPEALKASMEPIAGFEGSSTLSTEGTITRVDYKGTYDADAGASMDVEGPGRTHLATVVPPAANVLYAVSCMFPDPAAKDDLAACAALIDSLTFPEANDPVPDYIANGLTRFQYRADPIGGKGGSASSEVTARVRYLDASGVEVEESVSLPWQSELMAAPKSASVGLTVDQLAGPDGVRVQCSISTDLDTMGWESGVGAGKTCDMPPTTLEAMGPDFEMWGSSPSPSATASPTPPITGSATVIMSSDRRAHSTGLDPSGIPESFPAKLEADAVQMMWLGDPISLELYLDPAAVGRFTSTAIDFPVEPPTARVSFGAQDNQTAIIEPGNGECTITIHAIAAGSVSGSFRCPKIGLAFPSKDAKTVTLAGSFDAAFADTEA